jgi:hypothetical protein
MSIADTRGTRLPTHEVKQHEESINVCCDCIRIAIVFHTCGSANAIGNHRFESYLQNFRIWSGPGTSSVAESEPLLNRAPETFIVANWSPLAAPPSDLMRYQVSFYADHHTDGLDHVVMYVPDPTNHRAFVYLPGKGEPEYSLNVFSIYRGLEGTVVRGTTGLG